MYVHHNRSNLHACMASLFFTICHLLLVLVPLTQAAPGGQWNLLQKSIGISVMHMQLLRNDRIVAFDRTDFGTSDLRLRGGKCRTNDQVVKLDCTAHSVEYNINSNTIRPLMVQTNVFCSSGSVSSQGRLIQMGGFKTGERAVRILRPCQRCDWEEFPLSLNVRRWYASSHLLPDNRIIVIGGRRQFNYEFYPKTNSTDQAISFPFLSQTHDPTAENNLYPLVHLNVDGNLFIFANNRSILFDYTKNMVVKTFPEIPGGEPRTYPSSGSSVLLPIHMENPSLEAEVLICGGAPRGSFEKAEKDPKEFIGALKTCGRIRISDPNPKWSMESMPLARVMGDMILLPNGHVLIINGAAKGSSGWENGDDPVLHPVLYKPDDPSGSRFQIQNPSSIPRLYHSTAVLVSDGRVLVAGSNPHKRYIFSNVTYPTELSLEAFSPEYLSSKFLNSRPTIISPTSQAKLRHGQELTVSFKLKTKEINEKNIWVTLVAPSFATHSVSMNQKLLVLAGGNARIDGPLAVNGQDEKRMNTWVYNVTVKMPASTFLAPAGYYLLFVVNEEIPSEGIWVRILPNSFRFVF